MFILNLLIEVVVEIFYYKCKYEIFFSLVYDFIRKKLEKVIFKGMKVERYFMGEKVWRGSEGKGGFFYSDVMRRYFSCCFLE